MQSCTAEDATTLRLIDEVTPVIEGVIRGRVGASEREELFSEVILQLLPKLQEIESEPAQNPITNLTGYAAVTAFHVVHAHLRRAHPELHRLRNRIRHVVRTSASFALWQLPSGRVVCGRPSWIGIVSEECSERDLDRIPPISPRLTITQALDHVFDHVRKPVELEQLVTTIAEMQSARSEWIDTTSSIESSLVHRSALLEVWREIALLPSRQRIALLLGIRDESGSSITSLLILLRIVTFDELAVAVELSSEELAAIWDQLPLPDSAIAARLDLSRQQVINLRKSARERLARRLHISPASP
jgi:DNA-directed RNA polymerase specialized sigma24 family protein